MYEWTPHHAFARPRYRAIHGRHTFTSFSCHFDLLARSETKCVRSCERSDLAVANGNRRPRIGGSQRLQEFGHWPRHFASHFRVREQANAMRSSNPLRVRVGSYYCFDYFELAKHRGGKQRRATTLGDQVLRNWSVAHVRSGAQGRLPITETPVPRRPRKRWPCLDELLYTLQIEV